MMPRRAPLMLALLLLSTVSFGQQQSESSSAFPIFPASGGPQLQAQAPRRPLAPAKRSGRVHVDLDEFRRPDLARRQSVTVDRLIRVSPFTDVLLDVRLTRVERTAVGSVVWSGLVENHEMSAVTIAVQGDRISATFAAGPKRFVIRSTKSGEMESLELSDDYPEGSEPIEVPLSDAAESQRRISANADASAGAGPVADILVVYTANVRDSLGGTAAAQAFASEAIASTNQAYENSGVTLRVRLTGAVEVTYADNPVALHMPLEHLRNSQDEIIDHLHQLRDTQGADAVAFLVIGDGASCGVAYRMTVPSPDFADFAFSVTDVACAIGNLSFAHELGHNFSLKHDRLNSTTTDGVPYAFGYQDPEGAFRDAMSYANGCMGECPRLSFFSNPDLTISGRPAGVNSSLSNAADNRRALNESAATVSSFRETVTPITFSDDPLISGVTLVKLLHLAELRAAIDEVRSRAGLAAFSWSALPPAGATINASHLIELRTAASPAFSAMGESTVFTDPTLTAGVTPIRAIHMQELRDRLR